MRPTFYIHIGVPKTGSKSIQNTLSKNRDKLLAHGINFFPRAPNQSVILGLLLSDAPHKNVHGIMKHVDTPEKAASFNETTKHEITKWLAQNRSPKMLISGEGLSCLPDKQISRLKQMLDPYASAYRIIAYVRDPYEYVNSAWLQEVKSGSVIGTADWRTRLPDYRAKLSPHIRVFGRENVDIRILDSQRLVGGNLISDFVAALGESPQLAESFDVVRLNESMSHEAAMILSEANRAIPMIVDGRANRARAFKFHVRVNGIKGEKFSIDPNTYMEHEAQIAADVEWLNQTIGESFFRLSNPRRASEPHWSEATRQSIENVVSGMVSEFKKFHRRAPHVSLPPIPVGLEWLQPAYAWRRRRSRLGRPPSETVAPTGNGQTAVHAQTQSIAPQFDQASIRALGCFLHSIALAIQHARAEISARRGKQFQFWVSPRKAEDHFRNVVRLNPASAAAQFRLSVAHLLQGDFVEAQAAAEAAAQAEPNRPLFKRWLRVTNAAKWWHHTPRGIASVRLPESRRQRARNSRGERRAKQQGTRSKLPSQARTPAPPRPQ
jgi:hypothetical protein